MQVSVEKSEGLERKLKVAIPATRINDEMGKRFVKLSKHAKLRGFRPGKIPLSVIKRQFGGAVRAEIVEELLRATFVDAVKQEDLQPAGAPGFDITANDEGADFEYVATFEVYPEIKLKDFGKLAITKQTTTVGDKDIEKLIENMRKQRAEWVEVTSPAKVGDRVTMDYKGTLKGEAFEGGSAENHDYELGSNTFLPEFETHLLGVGAGADLTFKVKFPKDYHGKDLAGKKAEFSVKVHKVVEPKLPELDEAFVKAMGVTGGLKDFRAEVQKNVERELAHTLESGLKKAVFDQLLEANPIEVPKAQVEAEISQMQRDYMTRLMGKVDEKLLEKMPRDMYQEEAVRRVKIGLLLAQAIKEADMKPDPARIDQILGEMVASYENPDEMVAMYRKSKEGLAQLNSLALEQQIVDAILAKAKVTEKTVSYDGVMNPKN